MLLNCGVGQDSSESLGTTRRSNQSILKEISPGFIGRTNFEAETPILCPCVKEELTHLKWPWCWEDWKQEEKGTTEDEMVGWHHWLNGHGFGWTLGVSDGQWGLVCCGSWGRKESDMTEQQNWTELKCRRSSHLVRMYVDLKTVKQDEEMETNTGFEVLQ